MMCNVQCLTHTGLRLALIIGTLVAATFPSYAIAQSLTMAFRNKPPYSYIENGEQKGFLLERTRRLLKQAGIEAVFVDMPPKRIFAEIEAGNQPICSFGWYKIPERERYALFSEVLHQDKPHLLLTSEKSALAIQNHTTLKSLMSDRSLTLSAADGVSYGPELDAMIATFPGKTDKALIPPLQVAKKIAAGRADFMFIDQEDYDYLMASNHEFRGEPLVRTSLKDMPAGLKRYILCSRKVDTETMSRIDAAIRAESATRSR